MNAAAATATDDVDGDVSDIVFLVNCLPFIGFGLLDNAVMIIAVSLTWYTPY